MIHIWQRTTLGSFGEFLVVFDAGSGYELKVMEAVPHNCLVIAVPDLTYIAKSFNVIDWLDTWNSYCNDDNKAISFFIFDEQNDTPEGLIGSMSHFSTPGLDHSFVFYRNEDDKLVQNLRKKALSIERIHMPINYLGFAMDEYNMLWHSWHSILEEPKIFSPLLKS